LDLRSNRLRTVERVPASAVQCVKPGGRRRADLFGSNRKLPLGSASAGAAACSVTRCRSGCSHATSGRRLPLLPQFVATHPTAHSEQRDGVCFGHFDRAVGGDGPVKSRK